ncbi:MAG: GmrSD restriction endonuclease domain-containing protein [Terriglobales bacterium]
MIHNRELALPDFQRDFVWDPFATDELIESIISNYPAGSLLRIKNGHQLLFQPRAVEGAPALAKDVAPAYLVLDGQQRLTSLYQAFYGAGDHGFLVNLRELEKGTDLEDCVFYLRTDEANREYGSLKRQAESFVFPLGELYGGKGFAGWMNEVLRERCSDMQDMLSTQKRLQSLYEQWVRPIEEYEFPMVTLHENTSGAAVCTIFETLNRTGVKLSVFELLTARFWAEELNLRSLWEEVLSEFPVIEDYEVDPYYVLQIIGLLEPSHDDAGKALAASIKRSAILDMEVEQVRRGWRPAVTGLAETLEILREECGVLAPYLLPYNTIVIPMAATWAPHKDSEGAALGAKRIKLLRWFWCAVFGQRYENAPNSQAEKDFAELNLWLEGGPEPATVLEFRIEELRLRQTRPKQRAVYRGTMALILQNGALDFHKRGRITSQLLSDRKNPVDDHHIFPKAFLNERDCPVALRDCVLNRTYIDRVTNRRLSRRSPSDYFGEIREKHGPADADALLRSHLLPTGQDSVLLSDEFEKFIAYREAALLSLIAEKTGRQAPANIAVDSL